MATKAQLIDFIVETFEESDGNPVSRSKLDTLKKGDLEEFIKARNVEADLETWLNAQ